MAIVHPLDPPLMEAILIGGVANFGNNVQHACKAVSNHGRERAVTLAAAGGSGGSGRSNGRKRRHGGTGGGGMTTAELPLIWRRSVLQLVPMPFLWTSFFVVVVIVAWFYFGGMGKDPMKGGSGVLIFD
jgi:hypothetical protein